MLGVFVQKITLAQKKTLGHIMYLFAIDLVNCSLGTAGIFLLPFSIFYLPVSKNRQRMCIPMREKKSLRFNLAVK